MFCWDQKFLSDPGYLTCGPFVLQHVGCIGCHVISLLCEHYKMVDDHSEHLKIHVSDVCKKKGIFHDFEERIHKSVTRVTVKHHSAEPPDAKR